MCRQQKAQEGTLGTLKPLLCQKLSPSPAFEECYFPYLTDGETEAQGVCYLLTVMPLLKGRASI